MPLEKALKSERVAQRMGDPTEAPKRHSFGKSVSASMADTRAQFYSYQHTGMLVENEPGPERRGHRLRDPAASHRLYSFCSSAHASRTATFGRLLSHAKLAMPSTVE